MRRAPQRRPARLSLLPAGRRPLPPGPGCRFSGPELLYISSACSGLPCRVPGLVIVHDDVGVIGRAGRVEVEQLGG